MSKRGAQTKSSHRFKPYPAYKDSGVEWLREIPANWEVYSLRRKLFREAGSIKIGPFGSQLKLEFMTQEGFKVYGQEHVIARDFGLGSKYIDQAKFSELAACEIRPHDLVITMMGSSGRCAVVPQGIQRGIMDSHLLRVRLPDAELDPRFLCLLIDESAYVKDQIGALGKGAIMHGLNSSIIKSILLAVPPPPDQLDILAFFDRETTRIDALVEKKERLIALLHERRTALISRAVTRGLDPSVSSKESGIEWLGLIPTHWKVMPLKRLLTRCDYGISESLEGTGDIRVLTMAHIQNGEVLLPDFGSVTQVANELFLDRNDLLFNRTNSRELVGKVGIFRGVRSDRVTFASYLVRMTVRDGISPNFLNFLLNSPGVLALVRGMAMLSINQANLNPTRYTQIKLPLPPEREQEVIADFLDVRCAEINAIISTIGSAIDRLKELRAALISATVTGKIDVREKVV